MAAKLISAADHEHAARILREGGLVAFPTDTVYGIAGLADDQFDNATLRAFKGGRRERFSLHAGSTVDALRYGGPLRTLEAVWVKALAPHGVTLVVAHAEGTLGLRVVRDKLGAQLLMAVGAPVVATSANLHGQPVLNDPGEIVNLPGVDAVLDGGILPERPASTVVRLLPVGVEVLRHGAVDASELQQRGSVGIEFVCLGNLNRSAFAEHAVQAMQAWLAEHVESFVPILNASSSGVIASPAMHPPQAMLDAASARGVDLSTHTPRRPTPDRLSATAMVVAMGDDVADEVAAMAGHSILNFQSPDPMGGPAQGYAAMASHVATRLDATLARWAGLGDKDQPLEAQFRKLFLGQGDTP
jgi:L-threonylcarbamoyladenylate synthase